ncbi:DUF5994 family protein [Streptomyces rimosus]
MTVLAEPTPLSSARRTAGLSLVPASRSGGPLDGDRWPCSRDLGRELPALTATLDALWDRITHITVNPSHRPVIPRKTPVHDHVVRVGAFRDEQDPHELFLASYTVGRWDRLILAPETAPGRAAALTHAAADPHDVRTARDWGRRPGHRRSRLPRGRRTACTRCPEARHPPGGRTLSAPPRPRRRP